MGAKTFLLKKHTRSSVIKRVDKDRISQNSYFEGQKAIYDGSSDSCQVSSFAYDTYNKYKVVFIRLFLKEEKKGAKSFCPKKQEAKTFLRLNKRGRDFISDTFSLNPA